MRLEEADIRHIIRLIPLNGRESANMSLTKSICNFLQG
ncbi:hypothetical protein SAMN04490203_1201 [Pseudomonas taetrolens]|uniref:Integrase n=1 Tax=Pseudomonas taetrolens TaxID=47884 RepID=A0A1H4MBX6_PSETA|nr:hypothetical protein SAMN04490203_1201 [Pseudomonas taetrolens]SQF85383.1 Uncharacterised protein [Pseudomonas taetrolens]